MVTTIPVAPVSEPVARASEPAILMAADPPMEAVSNAPFVERVREAVDRELGTGSLGVASLSRTLGTSSRTLQRRLGELGLSFRDVVDEVREKRARAYLTDPALSTTDIARLLGYAEVSAFLRAFKRWTGTTPGRVRAASA